MRQALHGSTSVVLLLLLGSAFPPLSASQDLPLQLQAMKSELNRNFQALKKEQVPPYYLAYCIDRVATQSAYTSFGSISLNSLKELLASSDEDFVYDYQAAAGGTAGASSLMSLLFGGTGMPATDYPATVITPAFIMQGVDIKKPTGDYRKPPIVGYPGN